jgi:acyl carrier protein
MTTADQSEAQILDDVVEILVQVLGDDFLLEVEVSPATTFNDDLAVESIELVALSERLQERYGGRVDFVAFVADLDIEQIMAMTVGDLVDYIAASLARADATAALRVAAGG